MDKQKVIVILGQTTTGKSSLAVELAKKFNGEVISADSRQVYKGLDIGSGKITDKEMRGIKHYALSYFSPTRNHTVAHYKKISEKALREIYAKNKLPIICGGTGLYINVLLNNIDIPEAKPNSKLRAKLEILPVEKLFAKLLRLDPGRAKTLEENGGYKNKRRIIRALEIFDYSKKPIPHFGGALFKTNSNFNVLYLGIKIDEDILKKKINRRLKQRINKGLIKEVVKLHGKEGLSWKKLNNLGLEYRYTAMFLQGTINKKELEDKLQKEIWKYAKRQKTWFKKNEEINWIKNKKEAFSLTKKFILS